MKNIKKTLSSKIVLAFSIIMGMILIFTVIFFAIISQVKVPSKVLYSLYYAEVEKKELYLAIEDMTNITAFSEGVGEENEWEELEVLVSLVDAINKNIFGEKLANFIYAYSNSLEPTLSKTSMMLKYIHLGKLKDIKRLKENIDLHFDDVDIDEYVLDIPAFTIEESRAISMSLGEISSSIEGLGWQEKKDMLFALNNFLAAEKIVEEVSYKDIARLANLAGIILGGINYDVHNMLSSISKIFNFFEKYERVLQIIDLSPTIMTAMPDYLISLTATQIMEAIFDVDNFEGLEKEYIFSALVKAFLENASPHSSTIKEELNLIGVLLFSFGLGESEGLGEFLFELSLDFPHLTGAQLNRLSEIFKWNLQEVIL